MPSTLSEVLADTRIDLWLGRIVRFESHGPVRIAMSEETAAAGDVTATYRETETERILAFERGSRTVAIAQNREGYAMLKVRPTPDGDELEWYYGFDMALDHAGELLGVHPSDLPVPEAAADMGM
jgi:hypothetical protein